MLNNNTKARIKQMSEKELELEIKDFWQHIQQLEYHQKNEIWDHSKMTLKTQINDKYLSIMQIIMITDVKVDEYIQSGIDNILKNNQYTICKEFSEFKKSKKA